MSIGQFTGAHFPDIIPHSFDINHIMKFDLNVSTKAKHNANEQGL